MADCPRCGSERELENDYCAWCGWGFNSGWIVCESCGMTIKNPVEGCGECSGNYQEDPWYDEQDFLEQD
jgi:transcription initiation factor TFIIIB Brf1 subunit/transcription initiation factor TFIIB|tara:strand:+ start:7387 stop:7593 length:207 start_codon:yes stop_codon:yes gene_type:complete